MTDTSGQWGADETTRVVQRIAETLVWLHDQVRDVSQRAALPDGSHIHADNAIVHLAIVERTIKNLISEIYHQHEGVTQ